MGTSTTYYDEIMARLTSGPLPIYLESWSQRVELFTHKVAVGFARNRLVDDGKVYFAVWSHDEGTRIFYPDGRTVELEGGYATDWVRKWSSEGLHAVVLDDISVVILAGTRPEIFTDKQKQRIVDSFHKVQEETFPKWRKYLEIRLGPIGSS